MKSLVLYHADCNDGFCAAWVMSLYLKDPEVEFVAVHYGDNPPIVNGRDVYIVDFSYPREVMIDMEAQAASLVVLDHHKSAQADCEGLDFCTFDMDESGASLAWKHSEISGGVWIVEACRAADLWQWDDYPNARALKYSIDTWPRDFAFWSAQIEQEERWVTAGEAIQSYAQTLCGAIAENARFLPILFAEYDGVRSIPIVECPRSLVSETLNLLAEKAPFAIGYHIRANGKFHCDLRSKGYDVSNVANALGGGGHQKASGFMADRAPGVEEIQRAVNIAGR